ncbi:hypothetical protein GCM10027592_47010 [Spirosoma flavus]
MKTKDQIAQLKTLSIAHYLNQQGIQPVKKQGNELLYYSPKNEEYTPSFFVNPLKNVFQDFSGNGEKGDIIKLVQYLNECPFMEAVRVLEQLEGENLTVPFFFNGQSVCEPESKAIEITSIQALRNRSLIAYVESRKIAPTIATTYLNEVRYRIGEKNYYAIGFRNDKGGFELRNPYFKGCTSPKWFTHIPGSNSAAINLFEGIFDFFPVASSLTFND